MQRNNYLNHENCLQRKIEKRLTQHQRYLYDLAKRQDSAVLYHTKKKAYWFIFFNDVLIACRVLRVGPADKTPFNSITCYFKHHQPYDGLVEIVDAQIYPWNLYCFPASPGCTGYVRHIRVWA